MTQRVAPASSELRDFHSERYNWRNAGEERMRFHSAPGLARVKPGSTVLDIGSRNGDLREYLPPDVRYQGIDIAPAFAGQGEMNGFRLDGFAGTCLYPPIPPPSPLLSRSIVYRFVKA